MHIRRRSQSSQEALRRYPSKTTGIGSLIFYVIFDLKIYSDTFINIYFMKE